MEVKCTLQQVMKMVERGDVWINGEVSYFPAFAIL